ncbi:MAG: FMN-binding protein [Flavobacteriaceae bacterium]|nr:FMN-binding protein [Flavobacteriaceae bacterium]
MKKLFVLFIVISWSFTIPKKIEKKIDKEIRSVFLLESFSKEIMLFDEEISANLEMPFKEDNFFKISTQDGHMGYFYLGKAFGKTDDFDFLVIFDENLIIKKIKILTYREDYGGEISSKRWLKQFNGLTNEDTVVYKKNIKAISGATISVKSMTNAINDLLKSLTILQSKNQI